MRFPSSTLEAALQSQVQQIIPLVHIRVREPAVSDIYLSDRRCTVGGQLYLPRVLNLGEPGSDVLVSQDIKGTADNVQFVFGNADRAMTQLANDTDLKYAQLDLSLYHVNTGILLQLWSGFIVGYVADGSPQFTVQATDGIYQVTQQYPARVISRYCWKPFNDPVLCPFSSAGVGHMLTPPAGPQLLRLLLRFGQRLPGARDGSVLRRPSGQPAGHHDQGQFHRHLGHRAQHGHRDLHRLRLGLGQGAAGDLVQRRWRRGQSVLRAMHDRRGPRRVGLL